MVPALGSAVGGVLFTGFKYAAFNRGSYTCASAAIDLVSGALWGWGTSEHVQDNENNWELRKIVKATAHIAIANLTSHYVLQLTNALPLWARVAGFGVLMILGEYSIKGKDVLSEDICDIISVGAMLSAATLGLLAQAAYNGLPRV